MSILIPSGLIAALAIIGAKTIPSVTRGWWREQQEKKKEKEAKKNETPSGNESIG